MSATNATSHPSSRTRRTMFCRFSASRRPCAVSRTMRPPAAAMRPIWATQASVSLVSVLVIDCTATECAPPMVTGPNETSHDGRRENWVRSISILGITSAKITQSAPNAKFIPAGFAYPSKNNYPANNPLTAKTIKRELYLLLSALGFSEAACNKENEPNQVDMYGTHRLPDSGQGNRYSWKSDPRHRNPQRRP